MSKPDSGSPTPLEFPTGSSVPFPYPTPYPQQVALMDTMLQCLRQREQEEEEESKDGKEKKQQAAVLMLESPTGTGKSLSLACSAMAWLKYCEQRDLAPIQGDTKKENEPTDSSNHDWWNAWVPPETTQLQQDRSTTRETAVQARNQLMDELDLWRTKLNNDNPAPERFQQRRENFVRQAITRAKMAERVGNNKRVKKNKANSNKSTIPKEEDFCVTDYRSDTGAADQEESDSDSDSEKPKLSRTKTNNRPSAMELLEGHRLDGSHRGHGKPSDWTTANVQAGSGVRKIIYAARTHSQLSQFVGELKRTAWGSTTRVVALGSRQLLCGNTALKKKHPTEGSLTEACLDLKQGTTTTSSSSPGKKRSKGKCGCPFLESKEATATLGLHLLTTPSDIEDIAQLGMASRTCAYYASRKALAAAEVVVLPYSMLLSKPTREAIGLSLKGSLVLVDEAHNLPEALRQLHSSTLSLPVIEAALQQLSRYTQTYAQRLAGRNLIYLGHLRKLLLSFAKYLKKGPEKGTMDKEKQPQSKQRTLQSTIEFLIDLRVDNINLFKLIHYLEHSRLSQKLLGFTRAKEGEEDAGNSAAGLSKHVSAMSIVQTFLEKLNLRGQEGKIVTDWPDGNDSRAQHPTLRYVLLQPASCFENVLEEAHALALVGGTLSPFGHVAAELLASDHTQAKSIPLSHLELAAQADAKFLCKSNSSSVSFVSPRFAAFTCDHVVPSSNVFVKCLSNGPNGQKMDFRHQSRMASALCQDLGKALLKLSKAVPNGLVVFLPSYNYEAHLVKQWKQTGLFDELNRTKKIFREPKSAQQLEATLRSYAKQAATEPNSEATGSSSGGALLLSVIGGKMSEGINLSNSMARGVVIVGLPYPDITDPELQEKMATMTKHGVGGISGQAYYQNLCMRAVNQSVGRAIRHANDYAGIFLCDYRYSAQTKIWGALPKWLRNAASSPHSNQGYAALAHELMSFFASKEHK